MGYPFWGGDCHKCFLIPAILPDFPCHQIQSLSCRPWSLTLPLFAIPTELLISLTSPVFPDKKHFYHTSKGKVKNFFKNE
jgi:hypothetical protein